NAALSINSGDQTALGLRDKIKEAKVNACYQDAMRDAQSRMSKQEWAGAAAACNKALTYRPDDQRAREFLDAISIVERNFIQSIPVLDPPRMLADVWGEGESHHIEQRFAMKYNGLRIKYSGEVKDILKNENSVIFKTGGSWPETYKVKGTFPIEDAGKTSKVVKGQKLVILGVLKGMSAPAFAISANVIQVSITSVLESPVENTVM